MAESPNIVTLLAEAVGPGPAADFLHAWQDIIFAAAIAGILATIAFAAAAKRDLIPGRLQAAGEIFVGGVDDFVCGIIGPHGRAFTPFIGTLFIYILTMNLVGLVPFMKSPTANWSVTLALALCVFVYVQYAAVKGLGLRGYCDHLLGKPRGILAFTVFIPVFMFFLHIVSELVRPISLSLRLRSNIWGDDMLLTFIAGFGVKGIPLLIFNDLLAIIASVVQAVVFCLLTTIYFALVLSEKEG